MSTLLLTCMWNNISRLLFFFVENNRRTQQDCAPGSKNPPGPLCGVSDQPGGSTFLLPLQQIRDLFQPAQADLRSGYQVGNHFVSLVAIIWSKSDS